MKKKERPNIDAQYISEQRTIDVLKVLKENSDEEHFISQKEILENIQTTDNQQTLANTIDEILLQINPVEYTEDNDGEYRIKYSGYDAPCEENPLVIRHEVKDLRNKMRRKDADKETIAKEITEMAGSRTPSIKDIRYVHDFSYDEMNQLISAVALSASISPEAKENLIAKIMATASKYYKNPFYDKVRKRLKFNPCSEYSRIHSKKGETEKRIGENVRILQEAISKHTKVKFHFDVYSVDKCYVTDKKIHVLTPYYIVIYNDFYYLIGAWDNGDYAAHYRIDLMSDLQIVLDDKGLPVHMRPMSKCKTLPSRDETWDPEKYMSEHLYMAYENEDSKPRRIKIKIPKNKINRYTILHDWFGDHFELNRAATAKCEEGYEVVDVVTSPTMIVPWAMQYGTQVEIMDEEVRKEIREENRKVMTIYEEKKS